MRDGLRLAFGTLTVLPTRPPGTVDQRSAGWAMTFSPLVGAVLAALSAVLLWLLGWDVFGDRPGPPQLLERLGVPLRPAAPLLAATLCIGSLALLTRGIHLDGLADTADGLGSGRPPEQALELMRRGDVGPFGVATLVIVLILQVAALAQILAEGRGLHGIVLALVLSRLMLPIVCLRGVPAARPEGLGHAVAGSVTGAQLLLAVGFSLGVLLALVPLTRPELLHVGSGALLRGGFVATVALLAGSATCLWCVRRLGGVTGDVMGACVEVTFTAACVVLTLV